MLDFMDLVQKSWLEATNWNRDNSYSELNATSQALLHFHTPLGLALSLSSLTTPHLSTSYSLSNSIGLVDGSLSYLFSSIPLSLSSRSSDIPLHSTIEGYRQIREIRSPDEAWWWEVWQGGRRIDRRDTLLYGRLYLPTSRLEALYQRRLSPTRLLTLQCVSSSQLKDGGTLLATHTYDSGIFSLTNLLSTDSLLLGLRGLYNFSPSSSSGSTGVSSRKPRTTRLTLGAEAYYGILNTTLGLSTALRLATLPSHTSSGGDGHSFPFSSTLTLNPLMGQLGCTYAVKASRDLCFASEFGFNVYSYESDVRIGCELWKRSRPSLGEGDNQLNEQSSWARTRTRGWTTDGAPWNEATSNPTVPRAPGARSDSAEVMLDATSTAQRPGAELPVQGVLKARVDQKGRVGVLWEGRVKEMLFSAGVEFDLSRRERIWRGVGLEVMYSS